MDSQLMDAFAAELRDIASLRSVRLSVSQWLQQLSLARETRDGIVLAVHEAVANALQHAPPGSCVTVNGHGDGEAIIVTVRNEAPWAAPEPGNDERGRGLAIVAACVDDLEIHTAVQHTTATMRTRLHPPTTSPPQPSHA